MSTCRDGNDSCCCCGEATCCCETQVIDLDSRVNPNHNTCTVCTGDTSNNIFFVPRGEGFPGRCILDEMTFGQVYAVLRRTPRAAVDLRKITDDPILLRMANTVTVVEPRDVADRRVMNRINPRSGLPYYYVFRGKL